MSYKENMYLAKRLSPGSYSFQLEGLGNVNLVFEENPSSYLTHGIRLSGRKIELDEDGKERERTTVDYHSYGVRFYVVYREMKAELQDVIANFAREELARRREVLLAEGNISDITPKEHSDMRKTGRISSRLRRFKVDSF